MLIGNLGNSNIPKSVQMGQTRLILFSGFGFRQDLSYGQNETWRKKDENLTQIGSDNYSYLKLFTIPVWVFLHIPPKRYIPD